MYRDGWLSIYFTLKPVGKVYREPPLSASKGSAVLRRTRGSIMAHDGNGRIIFDCTSFLPGDTECLFGMLLGVSWLEYKGTILESTNSLDQAIINTPILGSDFLVLC